MITSFGGKTRGKLMIFDLQFVPQTWCWDVESKPDHLLLFGGFWNFLTPAGFDMGPGFGVSWHFWSIMSMECTRWYSIPWIRQVLPESSWWLALSHTESSWVILTFTFPSHLESFLWVSMGILDQSHPVGRRPGWQVLFDGIKPELCRQRKLTLKSMRQGLEFNR